MKGGISGEPMGNLEIGSPRFKPSVDKGLRSFVWNVGLLLKKGARLFRDSPRKLGYSPVFTLNNVNLVNSYFRSAKQ